jgi:hypothetical protein
VQNAYWTQRANFIDVPTDCPQRDERLGWTGDAQAYLRTATMLCDVQAFFRKWLVDLEDAQRADGQFPMVAPLKVAGGDGGPAWADAGVICPWTVWEVYGDRRDLARRYKSMSRFVEFTRARSTSELLPPEKFHCFGDWLNVDDPTPNEVIYSAYFVAAAQRMTWAARALGKTEEAAQYDELTKATVEAFRKAYVSDDGRIRGDSQTAYVLALAYDILEGEAVALASARLLEKLAERDWHLSTGFVGTKDLMLVLAKVGRNDVAYRLLENDTYPSWLFELEQGATSIWERWNGWTPDKGFEDPGMNSFAHYAFGAVVQWIMENVGGIRALTPGYANIQIRPQPGGHLIWAKTHYDSPRGPIETSWRIDGTRFLLDLTIPPSTYGRLYLPTSKPDSILEAASPLRVPSAHPQSATRNLQAPSGRTRSAPGVIRSMWRSAALSPAPSISTRRTLDWIRPSPGARSRILEVGCGAGELAAALGARGHEVVAIDSSPEAVRQTRARGVDAREAVFPRFEAPPFDVVLFSRSLHHIEDLAGACVRAREIVQPGGFVLVEDWRWNEMDRATAEWIQRCTSDRRSASCRTKWRHSGDRCMPGSRSTASATCEASASSRACARARSSIGFAPLHHRGSCGTQPARRLRAYRDRSSVGDPLDRARRDPGARYESRRARSRAAQRLIQVMPEVADVVLEEVLERRRLIARHRAPGELVQVVLRALPHALLLGDRVHDVRKMEVHRPPLLDELGPRPFLVTLHADPRVLVVAREHEVVGELRADEALVVVRGRVDHVPHDFFPRPLAGSEGLGRAFRWSRGDSAHLPRPSARHLRALDGVHATSIACGRAGQCAGREEARFNCLWCGLETGDLRNSAISGRESTWKRPGSSTVVVSTSAPVPRLAQARDPILLDGNGSAPVAQVHRDLAGGRDLERELAASRTHEHGPRGRHVSTVFGPDGDLAFRNAQFEATGRVVPLDGSCSQCHAGLGANVERHEDAIVRYRKRGSLIDQLHRHGRRWGYHDTYVTPAFGTYFDCRAVPRFGNQEEISTWRDAG